jgi:hypothetical protein
MVTLGTSTSGNLKTRMLIGALLVHVAFFNTAVVNWVRKTGFVGREGKVRCLLAAAGRTATLSALFSAETLHSVVQVYTLHPCTTGVS